MLINENTSLDILVVTILKEQPGKDLTSKELTELIREKYPDWYKAKAFKTQSGRDVSKQMANEISSRRPVWLKKHKNLRCSDSTPRKYSWVINEAVIADDKDTLLNSGSVKKLCENDLYPLLSHFLWVGPVHKRVYPKRIDEKTSSNKLGPKANEWLHPDLVGLEDLISDWDLKIQDCVENSGGQRARLWSFEVKLELSRSSVRSDYFQAVSNSSWANFGYLVAVKISAEAENEVRMLHGIHGIGLIELDTENPAESIIRIPARERKLVDWESSNRLAKENKDFKAFAKLVSNFYKTHGTSEKEWDIPASVHELTNNAF